jgi:hypothetical protein
MRPAPKNWIVCDIDNHGKPDIIFVMPRCASCCCCVCVCVRACGNWLRYGHGRSHLGVPLASRMPFHGCTLRSMGQPRSCAFMSSVVHSSSGVIRGFVCLPTSQDLRRLQSGASRFVGVSPYPGHPALHPPTHHTGAASLQLAQPLTPHSNAPTASQGSPGPDVEPIRQSRSTPRKIS